MGAGIATLLNHLVSYTVFWEIGIINMLLFYLNPIRRDRMEAERPFTYVISDYYFFLKKTSDLNSHPYLSLISVRLMVSLSSSIKFLHHPI